MKKLLIIFICFMGLVFVAPHSYAADTGTTITFDVMPGVRPKVLPVDNKLPVVLTVTIDLAKYGTFCGGQNTTSFLWSVYEGYPGTLDQFIFPGGVTNTGKEETFSRSTSVITKSLTTTVTALPYPESDTSIAMPIYALVECGYIVTIGGVPTYVHKNVAQSAPVNITIPKGNPIYACVAPNGKYSCSPGNLSSCSDVVGGGSQCGQNCKQIRTSLCGSTAPAGPSTSMTPTPNTSPGGDQTYSFDIPNPLKGGASDFTSLVKIIAQWIFNLAIPIAVAMIVYAGILFLTAAGETAKVTKAKEVLKYAVIGLAIILIGSGFVTLIQSILELGGTGQPQQTSTPTATPVSNLGAVGNICSKDSNCFSGLKCKNTICQRADGNLLGEACVGGTNCTGNLVCAGELVVIDNRTLNTCSEPSGNQP